ncbi:AAC(3) family N-acetyltransferase [Kitasatospora sp. GP82]|uniref:aminoglycoside N(3)-acetyltransferase n=1 Tax=Kitasatospora sp. GP82 TaxID=3035089 RepID=UPI0024751994|nr:AAC(3) family N-acetyltransferase [Kitasatospora sp. GP82]MDH6126223.1 aminoglycoside 3-N-acetyltransferase [Kitasatospora sp. GP82]
MHGVDRLEADLGRLGVQRGETLLVQSSLRSIGPMADGARTLLEALLRVLGPDGTLVVYTATPENSNTSRLALAPTDGMTPEQRQAYWDTRPPFDRSRTPTSKILGHFSELVRRQPEAVRSSHPQTSFTALGHGARDLMRRHRWAEHLGVHSPVQRLHDRGARALLIGVPVWCCTAFHLAEYRQQDPPMQRYGCVVTDRRGQRRWVHFEAVHLRDEHFEPMASALEAGMPSLLAGTLGDADCYLLRITEGVDVADKFLRDHHI